MKDYATLKLNDSNIAIHESVFVSIAKEIISDENGFEEKSISVSQKENEFTLNIDVKVKNSINITDKCSQLQKRIMEITKQITDIRLSAVNIRIVGFIF